MRLKYPAIFDPIGENDLFVGFYTNPLVGFRYSWSGAAGWNGYFADLDTLNKLAEDSSLTPEENNQAQELAEFWAVNRTAYTIRRDYPELVTSNVEGLTEIYVRLAEINLDFNRLLRLGIPGLKSMVQNLWDKEKLPIQKAQLGILELLTDSLMYFSKEASEKALLAEGKRKHELLRMAETLEYLTDHAPDTFYGALSLFHLVAMITTVDNFARMDVYMGDFLVKDLENGTLTREEALDMLVVMYDRFGDMFPTTGRIIIGGEGRRNVDNADQRALFLLDAAKIVHKAGPTLCLSYWSYVFRWRTIVTVEICFRNN